MGVRQGGQEDQAEFKIDIDQAKARALGLDLSDVNTTISLAFAGSYVNDFIDRGKVKPVYIQGEGGSRSQPGQPRQLVCPQCLRRDGAFLVLHQLELVAGLAEGSTATTASLP